MPFNDLFDRARAAAKRALGVEDEETAAAEAERRAQAEAKMRQQIDLLAGFQQQRQQAQPNGLEQAAQNPRLAIAQQAAETAGNIPIIGSMSRLAAADADPTVSPQKKVTEAVRAGGDVALTVGAPGILGGLVNAMRAGGVAGLARTGGMLGASVVGGEIAERGAQSGAEALGAGPDTAEMIGAVAGNVVEPVSILGAVRSAARRNVPGLDIPDVLRSAATGDDTPPIRPADESLATFLEGGVEPAPNVLDEASKAARRSLEAQTKTAQVVSGAEDVAQGVPSRAAAQELAKLSAEKRGMQRAVGRAVDRGDLTGRQVEIAEEQATRTLTTTKLPRTQVREEGVRIYKEQPELLANLDETTPTTPQLEYAASLKYGELLDKHVAIEQQIAEAADPFEKTGLEDALGSLSDESERVMRFLNRTGTEAGQALAHRANILRYSPDAKLTSNAERLAKRTKGRPLTSAEQTELNAAVATTKKARRKHTAAREGAVDKALGDLPGMSAFRRRVDQLTRDSQTKVAEAIKSRIKSLKSELERRTNQAMTERSGLGQDMEPPANPMTPEELALVADDPTVKALNELVQNMRLQQQRKPLPDEFASMRKRVLKQVERREAQLTRRLNGEPEIPARDLTSIRKKVDADPGVLEARERVRDLERKLAEQTTTQTLGPVRAAFAGLRSGLLTGVETLLFRNPLSTYSDATVRRTLSDNASYLIEAFGAARAEGDNPLQAARRALTSEGRDSLTLLGAPAGAAQRAELFDRGRFLSTAGEAIRTGVNPNTMATLGEMPQAVGDIKTVFGGKYDQFVNAPLRVLGGADAAAQANFQAAELQSIAEASAKILAQTEGRPLTDVPDIAAEMVANPTPEMLFEAQRRAGVDAYNNSVLRGKAVDGQRAPIAELGEAAARLFSTPAERMIGTQNRALAEGFDLARSGLQAVSGAYFLRTPVNLAERLAERIIPFGALATERGKLSTLRAEAVKSALKKHGSQAFQREIDKAVAKIDDAVLRKRVADALGENTSGAALTAAGAALAAAGVLVYSPATAEDRARADMADRPLVALRLPTGSLPGVDEDVFVDVSFMAPVMPNIVGGAAAQQYLRRLEQEAAERSAVAPDAPAPTAIESAGQGAMRGVGFLASLYGGNLAATAEMPLLQGPKRTVENLTTLPQTLAGDDPERIRQTASRFAGDVLRPAVPSAVSDVAKLFDPVKRERTSRDFPLIGGVMERVPGVRSMLQPQINRATGLPIRQDRSDVLTPVSMGRGDAWANELDRLGVVPGTVPVDAKAGESDTTNTRRQQLTYAALRQVMQAAAQSDPRIAEAPDALKAKILEEIDSEARRLIGEQIKGKDNPNWTRGFDSFWESSSPEERGAAADALAAAVMQRMDQRERGRRKAGDPTLLDRAIINARKRYVPAQAPVR